MFSKTSLAAAVGGLVATASAGFSSSEANNIAVYWGQNSVNSAGSTAQQRLSYYCSNTEFNIIDLAFLTTIKSPALNFANQGNNCTLISGSDLFSCPEIEADITECQSKYGKTILLSIGGATYTEGGFSTSDLATSAAQNIWSIFGPATSNSSTPRPFGSAVIDGFDFDFESTVTNMAPFANELRTLMTASESSAGKSFYLSAAPQCVYPDAADKDMLDGSTHFDWIQIQFYNNNCGLPSFVAGSSTQSTFNFETWDTWAKNVSANPDVKILLGIPASSGAAGSGYESGTTLANIITYIKSYSSFGGVMMWDMSQLWQNTGFLDAVYSDLGGSSGSTVTSSAVIASKTAITSISSTGSAATGGAFIQSNTVMTATSSAETSAASSTVVQSRTTIAATSSVGATAATTAAIPSKTPIATTLMTLTRTSASPSGTSVSGTGVAQWGQCGGEGYTGSTVCVSPYNCVASGAWWSQCE